jgi:DNA-directed RNA polymerase subunit RPC12/RpoP
VLTIDKNGEVGRGWDGFPTYEESGFAGPGSVFCPLEQEVYECSSVPGTYRCPGCGFDIEVDDGEATHVSVFDVDCPESGRTFVVPGEISDSNSPLTCPECKGWVFVLLDDRGWWRVFHEATITDVDEGLTVECPENGGEVELPFELATIHEPFTCPHCRARILVSIDERNHYRVLHQLDYASLD